MGTELCSWWCLLVWLQLLSLDPDDADVPVVPAVPSPLPPPAFPLPEEAPATVPFRAVLLAAGGDAPSCLLFVRPPSPTVFFFFAPSGAISRLLCWARRSLRRLLASVVAVADTMSKHRNRVSEQQQGCGCCRSGSCSKLLAIATILRKTYMPLCLGKIGANLAREPW